jgi:hypothetical protein
MTLPVVPGNSLSFSQINTELSLSSTATISLNDAAVRTLAGVGASPATISITNLSGKSNSYPFSITSNQANANLRSLAVAAGWPGTTKVVATINPGIFVYSTSTGTPALTVNGAFPNGVELVNNGTIQGQGGSGGNGGISYQPPTGGSPGSGGGLALSVSVPITITNNNRIAGGGGGGGGGAGTQYNYGKSVAYATGGGGGGGLGGNGGGAGAAGGGPGGNYGSPGTAGTQTTAGPGGGGYSAGGDRAGNGGAGGSYGSGGTPGTMATKSSIGPPPNPTFYPGGPGGAAGGAITGNSNITYLATGTINGGIS